MRLGMPLDPPGSGLLVLFTDSYGKTTDKLRSVINRLRRLQARGRDEPTQYLIDGRVDGQPVTHPRRQEAHPAWSAVAFQIAHRSEIYTVLALLRQTPGQQPRRLSAAGATEVFR